MSSAPWSFHKPAASALAHQSGYGLDSDSAVLAWCQLASSILLKNRPCAYHL